MRFGKGMVRAHTRRVKGKTVFVPAHRRIDHGTLPRARMKNSANMATTPEELASRFGPESERFQLRDKDDKPLLVRKFGRGKNHAFAVHDADGSHIATMHVKTNKDGARVTAGWTHDKHNRRGVHNALLHRLVSHHGTVTSPTSMHYDLHHAFNTMDDDHELSTERTEGGGGVRYRLQRKQMALFKGRVKAHWRKLPSGKIVLVREYTNKRTKKPQQAPARPESIQKTKEQIAEDSFTYGSGIFWRVHSKGKPLDPNAESWPWGMSREEAEELDLVLLGVSCMSNPEELVGYWEARGGVDDNLGEVVVFSGRLLDVPDEGDVAVPERELFRIPYSRVKAAVDADDYSLLDAPPPSTAS